MGCVEVRVYGVWEELWMLWIIGGNDYYLVIVIDFYNFLVVLVGVFGLWGKVCLLCNINMLVWCF